MAESGEDKAGLENLLSDWSRMTGSFLSNLGKLWPASTGTPDTAGGVAPGDKAAGAAQAGPLPENLLAWSTYLQDPANLQAMLQGMNNLPQIFASRAESKWDQFLGMQNQWMEKIAEVGKRTGKLSPDHLDEQLLALWNETYDKEIRRYLKMPAIGLGRFYQERAARFVDSFVVFTNAWEAFLQILGEPVEQTSRDLKQKVEELSASGSLPEDPHEIYNLWVKVLEGHYMTLFKSERYGKVMGRASDTYADFIMARNALLEDFLRILPVATERDSHDLYKEIYDLNKQVKQLTRQVTTLEKRLEESLRRKTHGSAKDPSRSHSGETGRAGTARRRNPPKGS